MGLFKKIFQENTTDIDWYLKAQSLWNYDSASYSNPKKALKYLEKSIQNNPNKDEAFMGQGIAYLQLGKHQKAIDSFNLAIHIKPNNNVYYLHRGVTYLQSKNYAKAIEDLNHLLHTEYVELDHLKNAVYLHRGLAYWESGKHEKAIEDYSQLIQIDPYDASNYNIRGWAYSEIGKQKEAISDFDKALHLQPEWAEALHNREVAYKRLKTHSKKFSTETKFNSDEMSIISCSVCLQKIRVPKGKKIRVTCNKCGHIFIGTF